MILSQTKEQHMPQGKFHFPMKRSSVRIPDSWSYNLFDSRSLCRTQQRCSHTWASASKARRVHQSIDPEALKLRRGPLENNPAPARRVEKEPSPTWGICSHLWGSRARSLFVSLSSASLLSLSPVFCFLFLPLAAGINKVRFDANDEIIEAMLSVEGEVVELISKASRPAEGFDFHSSGLVPSLLRAPPTLNPHPVGLNGFSAITGGWGRGS